MRRIYLVRSNARTPAAGSSRWGKQRAQATALIRDGLSGFGWDRAGKVQKESSSRAPHLTVLTKGFAPGRVTQCVGRAILGLSLLPQST